MFVIHKKHLAGALITAATLACSSAVLADFFPEDDDEGIFHIGIEGNYLWQSGNTAEIDSVGGFQNFYPIALPLIDKTPDASWGGGVNLAYIMPSHRYDISASYYFLRSDKTESGTLNTVQFGSGNIPDFPISADLDYDFDSADILMGTYFEPTKRWLLRVGYGLGFVRIDQQAKNKFDLQSVGAPPGFHVNDTSSSNKFTGIGPKVTLESDFELLRHVYVVAEAGFSALYGKAESELNTGGFVIDGQTQLPGANYTEDNYQGAFGFEGKLGLAYAHAMNEDMALRLEGGFKAQSYVNALQDEEIDVGSLALGPFPLSSNLDFDGNYSNFGPYVNLSVDFM